MSVHVFFFVPFICRRLIFFSKKTSAWRPSDEGYVTSYCLKWGPVDKMALVVSHSTSGKRGGRRKEGRKGKVSVSVSEDHVLSLWRLNAVSPKCMIQHLMSFYSSFPKFEIKLYANTMFSQIFMSSEYIGKVFIKTYDRLEQICLRHLFIKYEVPSGGIDHTHFRNFLVEPHLNFNEVIRTI